MSRLMLLCLLTVLTPTFASAAESCPELLDHRLQGLAETQGQSLCERHAGQVLLVVNTASYCGYTHQYAGLVDLYRHYRDRGLTVIGFPSNDFAQEPGSEGEIRAFCELTYDVDFPMYQKIHVRGGRAHPLYRQLAEASGEAPGWNFHKYLIGRDGETVLSFPTRVAPEDPRLRDAIERLLEVPPGQT
ncbi:MAG: hypothetical protein R3202_13625 [Candidatus Competibacterales bacterium]|nr:hypothetical protein [Candidatus Competibacterales bacterium]